MVTNKYDSIKSICWNRPEQSGFRLCEVRGIYTVLTVEHTIEKVGSFFRNMGEIGLSSLILWH